MGYEVSGDIIPIACYKCGGPAGFVPNRPGKYKVGCPKCNSSTDVEVKKDGSLKTW